MTDDDRQVSWIEAVCALPRGSGVVVRARDPKRREALAKSILRVARPKGVKTLIANDPSLAVRLRADGVHLPEKRTMTKRAAPQHAKGWIVTAAAHGAQGLRAAAAISVDATFLSPLFATTSHPGARSLGAAKWASLRSATAGPVFALGGITHRNAHGAVAAGADGIAVISGWVGLD
jgi:thiamine-phosphate pyrophosphorylase